MTISSTIHYLSHKEINKVKWDECIQNSISSLIYAQSFYLDAMAPGWCALANKNYDWVLPITYNTRFGINYLHQPNFVQQLGVFFKEDTAVPWQDLIEWMKSKFKFWEINWNYATEIDKINVTETKAATNFILDLSNTHYNIAAHYYNDLKNNLKHAKRLALTFQAVLDYEKSIDMYVKHYGDRTPHVKRKHYNAFKNLCAMAYKNNKLACREVVNENQKIMAIALMLNDGKRLYNVMNTTTEEGRKCKANHLLIDSIIKEFAESKLMLDFEGSDIEGVKAFYKNFGAVNQPYYMLKYNKLSWPLRLLK